VSQDERSSESCLHCEINDLVLEDVEGQETVDTPDLAANLEEAGTWYYVVDCATCKAVIPFKHAPEDEPILRFPTMTVRCFHCHTSQKYAPDLISHRKVAPPPRGILQRASDVGDGDQKASRDRQEHRGVKTSEGPAIVGREIDSLSSSLRRANILIAALSGKKATIFFLSSCFFGAGCVSQLALDILYPAPLAVVREPRLFGPAMLLGIASFGTVLLGLALFLFGIGSFFVETLGFKRSLIKGEFARIASYVASLTVHARSTVALFLTETWLRSFPTRELPGVLTVRVELGREGLRAQADRSGAFGPMPFKQALSPEDEPKWSPSRRFNWRWLLARGRNQGHSP
jgi:hypothetical protein